MAQVTVDVSARVQKRDLARASTVIHRDIQRLAGLSGRDFGREFARHAEVDTRRIIDTRGFRGRGRDAAREFERGFQPRNLTAQITADIDRDSRMMSRSIDAVTSSFANLGQAAGVLGKAGGPVAIAALVAGLTALAGVAAAATGALGVLPGVLGAAVAGFGALKIATLGFGDALSSIRDPEKFAEALQSLSPNAQQAALSIQNLLPAFDQLKNATQDSLFAGVGEQLNRLASTFMPQMQQLTTTIAGSLNQMFMGITDTLMTPDMQASIQSIVSNIGTAFQNLAPAMGPLTEAFTKLTEVGSGFLPELANAATRAAEAFSSFITEAAKSGDLERWISRGLDMVKQLAPVVGDVVKAFISLAPVGERVMPLIADTLRGVAIILPPIAEGAARIGPSVETVVEPVRRLGRAFNTVSDIVRNVGRIVGPILDAIRAKLDQALNPVREAIDIYNKVPFLPDLPQIPSIAPTPGGGGPGASAAAGSIAGSVVGEGLAPPPAPTSPIAPVPPGGYPVPLPPEGAGSGRGSSGPVIPVVPNSGHDPMELIKGFQPTSALYGAASSVLDARHRRAQAEAKLNALEASNEATAEQIQSARNELVKSEQDIVAAELRLAEAKRSATEGLAKATDSLTAAADTLGQTLDADLGLSRGLGGLVENLVKALGDALTAPLRNLLAPIAEQANGAKGLIGMWGERNVAAGLSPIGLPMPAGQQQQQGVYGATASSTAADGSAADALIALAQQADGGKYSWGASDLVNGLADCSGAVSDLVELLVKGRADSGRLFTTHNAGQVLQGLGAVPGFIPGNLNIGVKHGGRGGGHMAATLPNGVAFESGSHGINYGGPSVGADDPQFTEHWSLPVGRPTVAPSAVPSTATAAAPSASGIPIPLPVTIVGGALPVPGAPMPGAPVLGAPVPGGPTLGAPVPHVGSGAPPGPPQYGTGQPQGGFQPAGGGFAGLGGMPMGALQASVGDAANAFAPGSGAAAQMAMELINRTIGYAGQVAGIGVDGLMETFSVGDTALGDLGNSWLGKIAAGFAGAGMALPNSAGNTEQPMQQQGDRQQQIQQAGQQLQQGQQGPTVHIEQFVQAENRSGQQAANDLAFKMHQQGGR